MQTGDWSDIKVISLTDHHNYTIIGHSVASRHSCVVLPEFGIVFDAGFCPNIAMLQETVLITHGHADHIGALHLHAFDRGFHRHSKPVYLMPDYCLPIFQQIFENFLRLGNYPARRQPKNSADFFNLVSVSRDELEQNAFSYFLPKGKNRYFVKAYQMIHTVQSVSYIIWETKKKLKPELSNLSQFEICQMVKSGQKVSDEINIPLIAYTGDTEITGVLGHPDLLRVETLIMECTYIDLANTSTTAMTTTTTSTTTTATAELGHDRGHIHEKDIIENSTLFQNKEIILCHFSMRYREDQIREAQSRLQFVFGDRIQIQLFLG